MAKQFEPEQQMEEAFDELQTAMTTAKAALDRVEWLKDRLSERVRLLADTAADFHVYTEAEAAEIFGVTEQTLSVKRREQDLPHIAFGKFPRYTKDHLREIAEIFEIGKRSKAVGLKRAV